jgi:hypothetical protein
MSHLFDMDASQVASTTDDWYTPGWVSAAAGITFDMDVAAPVDPDMRTMPAKRYLTVLDDGLTTPWEGVIWCNPPYSKATLWCDKWASHPDGLILLPALPEVHWLGVVMGAADAFTLLAVDFFRPNGSTARLRWPNILAGRGSECSAAVARVARADKYAKGAYLTGGGEVA